ncbi:MAG: hypothetical protein NXH70_02705 [Hyphomonas sp.]|nr:hypothetical protein [Hyphomonas sp.]
MSLIATLTTVERILGFAGPLLAAMVGEEQSGTVDKVLDGVETAIRFARMGISGAEDFSEELEAIAAELEALQATGGPGEAEFDAAADRIASKTAALRAAVDARKAIEG